MYVEHLTKLAIQRWFLSEETPIYGIDKTKTSEGPTLVVNYFDSYEVETNRVLKHLYITDFEVRIGASTNGQKIAIDFEDATLAPNCTKTLRDEMYKIYGKQYRNDLNEHYTNPLNC